MTQTEAEKEATRRWGQSGWIWYRPNSHGKGGGRPGRLARYQYLVGSGQRSNPSSILGQGDTWREAFDDAHGR